MDFEGGFTETPVAPEPSVPAEPAASPQPAETTTTSGPTEASVRPSEPFMSEALSGVDLGGFEPTTSRDVVEPASDLGVEDAVSVDPNPFAINQSGLSEGGHEKVRQSQAASGSVGGTHHADAGKDGNKESNTAIVPSRRSRQHKHHKHRNKSGETHKETHKHKKSRRAEKDKQRSRPDARISSNSSARQQRN